MQGHTASQNQDRSDEGGADLPVLQCTTTVFLPFLNCLTIGAITPLSVASLCLSLEWELFGFESFNTNLRKVTTMVGATSSNQSSCYQYHY